MAKTAIFSIFTLFLSPLSFAQDSVATTITLKPSTSTIALDKSHEKNHNLIGIQGTIPLEPTAQAVERMKLRLNAPTSSNIQVYGTVDIGYTGTF